MEKVEKADVGRLSAVAAELVSFLRYFKQTGRAEMERLLEAIGTYVGMLVASTFLIRLRTAGF